MAEGWKVCKILCGAEGRDHCESGGIIKVRKKQRIQLRRFISEEMSGRPEANREYFFQR